MTLSERETAEITAANRSGRRPIVLVHGPARRPESWRSWRELLELAGYATVAAESGVAADDHDVAALVEHTSALVDRLDEAPVLVGHGTGGLAVQVVAGHGEVAGTVAIAPVASRGVLGSRAAVRAKVDRKNPERGPMLVVAGEDDEVTPVEVVRAEHRKQSKASAQPTELEVVAGGGHDLVADSHWQEVVDLVITFLDGVDLQP